MITNQSNKYVVNNVEITEIFGHFSNCVITYLLTNVTILLKYSAYNMMFTPLHVDRPVDTVRFWFKGGEGGLQKYNFYQKLVNSYK